MDKIRLKAYMLMNYKHVPGVGEFAWWVEPHCEEQIIMLDKHSRGEVTDAELINFAHGHRPK